MVKACQENTKYFSKFWSHLLDERAGLVEYRILNFSLTNADILLKTKGLSISLRLSQHALARTSDFLGLSDSFHYTCTLTDTRLAEGMGKEK